MEKIRFKPIFVPAISLTVICLIVTALLAGTNALTKDTIELQAQEKAAQARSIVLPAAKSFEEQTISGAVYYIGKDESGETVGYTFTTAAKGYGGDVEVMTGVDSRTEGISGVNILSQEETPGLGANAVKPEFTSQYMQDINFDNFLVIKNQEPIEGEIEALTGSTITSQAVTDAVNEALKMYNTVKGGV